MRYIIEGLYKIIEGMVTIFSFGRNIKSYQIYKIRTKTDEEYLKEDMEKLRGDWDKIGEDFNKVIGKGRKYK